MPGTTETIVLASAPCLPGSTLANILKDLDINLQQLTVVTSSGALQPNTIPQQAFDQGVSLTHSLGHHSSALLGLMAAALKPGASLTIYEPASGAVGEAAASVKKALLLAGFVGITDGMFVDGAQGQHLCVTASKPQYAVGAKSSINLKPKAKAQQASWTLDPDNDDEELMDEDDLLTEEDKQRPAVVATDDCEVGAGKKACKNCTCGRADAEAAVQKVDLSADMLENPQSACGSCGLGDAFRCSTCPYRGLPSFEMGKKIELGSDFLTADA